MLLQKEGVLIHCIDFFLFEYATRNVAYAHAHFCIFVHLRISVRMVYLYANAKFHSCLSNLDNKL